MWSGPSGVAGRGLAVLLACLLAAGCAALTEVRIPVAGADRLPPSEVAEVAVDPHDPVILRAVDGQPLSGIQVSNWLRAATYRLPAGTRELWLVDNPYGMPLLPQRLRCYVLTADLAGGERYTLAITAGGRGPVLADRNRDIRAQGVLVDAPSVMERGCRWR